MRTITLVVHRIHHDREIRRAVRREKSRASRRQGRRQSERSGLRLGGQKVPIRIPVALVFFIAPDAAGGVNRARIGLGQRNIQIPAFSIVIVPRSMSWGLLPEKLLQAVRAHGDGSGIIEVGGPEHGDAAKTPDREREGRGVPVPVTMKTRIGQTAAVQIAGIVNTAGLGTTVAGIELLRSKRNPASAIHLAVVGEVIGIDPLLWIQIPAASRCRSRAATLKIPLLSFQKFVASMGFGGTVRSIVVKQGLVSPGRWPVCTGRQSASQQPPATSSAASVRVSKMDCASANIRKSVDGD